MSEPLRLPEGYNMEMQRGEPDLLILKRADGSSVAAFEISAFGPEPDQIMLRMAWDEAEYHEQLKQNDSGDDN